MPLCAAVGSAATQVAHRLRALARSATAARGARALVRQALPALLCGLAALAAGAERPLWELGIGGAGLRLPHYRGSDQSHTWWLPVPYVIYRGPILKADREGARAVLFETERLHFDLSLSASVPTRSQDNRARGGMADLDPTIEFGPKLNLTLARGAGWQLDLRAPVRAVFTLESDPSFIGWTSTPSINLDLPQASGWNLGLQVGPVFGSRRYHAYYYDVAAPEARSGRPAYRSEGGYAGLQATVALSRRFERFWVGMFVKGDTLRGAVIDDSPLVRDHENLSFGIAVAYVFATSSRRVVAED